MGRVKRIAIEAKCFDLILDNEGSFFRLQVIERGRGFLNSLLLGRDASFWLLSTLKNNSLISSPTFIRRFEGEGKIFAVFRGRNNRGSYVLVTEFFGNGRRSSIFIPQGRFYGGWFHFSKALSALLNSDSSKCSTGQSKEFFSIKQRTSFGTSSFAEVVQARGKDKDFRPCPIANQNFKGPELVVSGKAPHKILRIMLMSNGKRQICWVLDGIEQDSRINRCVLPCVDPKLRVVSRLGPKIHPLQPNWSSRKSKRAEKRPPNFHKIWVPKTKPCKLVLGEPSLAIDRPPSSTKAFDCVKELRSVSGSDIMMDDGLKFQTNEEGGIQVLKNNVQAPVVREKEDSNFDSDSVFSSQGLVEEFDSDFDLEDLQESGLFTDNLHEMVSELPKENSSLSEFEEILKDIPVLFEQPDKVAVEEPTSRLGVSINLEKGDNVQSRALPSSGIDCPVSSSLDPLFPPFVVSCFPDIDKCAQSSVIFSGNKLEGFSQGNGLLPIPFSHASSSGINNAKGVIAEENAKAFCCSEEAIDEEAKDFSCSHPLFKDMGVKVVFPLDGPRILVESPVTYDRKKKKLLKELDRLASSVNYGGKLGRRESKSLNEVA